MADVERAVELRIGEAATAIEQVAGRPDVVFEQAIKKVQVYASEVILKLSPDSRDLASAIKGEAVMLPPTR